MFRHHHLLALLLTASLAACGTSTSSKRDEHQYAFGKPSAPQTAAAGVAPVVVNPPAARRGPAAVAHVVYFDFDAYTVRPEDRAIVEAHARWLSQHPGQSLRLPGHTDVRGGREYNLALGQKRAEAVRQSLQVFGIDPQRVEAVSYGKERLADEGTSEAAHQLNRRVEFDYR
ncbi:flagellar motor protein MotB [Comamonas serinivorans]|uniref:Peptidoglycan-associated lipoprotein n=1 Tax=Comamonas serinivorans TaxID=1082851 RepID=A0A1Y0EL58_9BURK|nr:OmpA family protein [Comamonas serinivorans]ARU04364.1 flagellar motor protein MotB [Comamonas serinivorans]